LVCLTTSPLTKNQASNHFENADLKTVYFLAGSHFRWQPIFAMPKPMDFYFGILHLSLWPSLLKSDLIARWPIQLRPLWWHNYRYLPFNKLAAFPQCCFQPLTSLHRHCHKEQLDYSLPVSIGLASFKSALFRLFLNCISAPHQNTLSPMSFLPLWAATLTYLILIHQVFLFSLVAFGKNGWLDALKLIAFSVRSIRVSFFS